jgi:NAD(P)-dependent dehydrogenase (short-subunit alcohol dehydrogenase family)
MLEKGIRVNCVAPGPVWTPLVVSSFSSEQNAQYGANVSLTKTSFQPTVRKIVSSKKIRDDFLQFYYF